MRRYLINTVPVTDWLIVAAIVATVLLILGILRNLLERRLQHAGRTETDLDDFLQDVVHRTKLWLVFFVVLYAGSRHLPLDPSFSSILRTLAVAAGVFQAGFWGAGLIDFWIFRYRRKRFETDPAAVTTISAFGFFGKIAIWIVVLLVGLENAVENFDITPLIASLGVGGIAIALATQNILGDLFASLSIVLDKPFVLGDFIVVGSEMGTVEKIGLKTTRVRSLSGEQLIFSNSDLLASRVRNFKRMVERRSLFSFGVTYGTSRELLERIPGIVREIIEATPNTRFDRAHFKKFGDSSLDFEVVYWMLVPEFNAFMDAQQAINLELVTRIEQMGAQFAFPTRTIHVESLPPAADRPGPEIR
jgi:small-conductance mechanosensitive channel